MKATTLFLLFVSTFAISDKELWDYLKNTGGYNDFGTAGLMGNMFAESGLAPNNLENICNDKLGLSDDEYTRRTDNGAYTNFVNDACGVSLKI